MNWNNGNGNPQGYPPQNPYQQQHQQQGYAHQGAPQQQPQMPPQGAPVALPELHIPDDQIIAQARQKAVEEAERVANIRAGNYGGGGLKFFSPPGPPGHDGQELKWEHARIGYEHRELVWLLPLKDVSGLPFVENLTHFWFSRKSPRGDSISANDIVKASRKILYNAGDTQSVEKANNVGKVGRKQMCQVIRLEHYQEHFNDKGEMVPFIWKAPMSAYNDIVEILHEKGAARVMDPQHGCPLIVKKKKVREGKMGVAWSVMQGDPQPLPQHFYPALHKIIDLNKLVKRSSAQDIHTYLVENGMPIDENIQQMLTQWAAEDTRIASQEQQQQGQQPSFQTGHAPPQPSPYNAPPQGQPQPAAQQPIQLIKGQTAAHSLPDGRERCFGNHNEAYQFCQVCPDWIKQQCLPQSAGQVQSAAPGQDLTQLKNQIGG